MRTLRIQVKPNARESSLAQRADGVWLAKLKSAPIDGKANAELVRLVAEHFRVSRASVQLRSGAGARLKLLQIPDGPAA
ncbi:MAG: DUF167 domain-containing protein [Steroidobacteraceae bacterium]